MSAEIYPVASQQYCIKEFKQNNEAIKIKKPKTPSDQSIQKTAHIKTNSCIKKLTINKNNLLLEYIGYKKIDLNSIKKGHI